jgi:flagellum-specific peptidoglycan hydrolase FlgJ
MIFFKSAILIWGLFFGSPKETMKPHVLSYIEEYKYMAIDEMVRSGIPASVTMAQAIIESNAGVSFLAKESNNHFGIKCKSYWNGHSFYHPDDDRDAEGNIIASCFRKYDSVLESYADHSDFLLNTPHYQPLFVYDRTEYEKWARGLQLCGYATDQAYGEKLIRTIKLYNLHELDYYTIQYVDRSVLTSPEMAGASQEK